MIITLSKESWQKMFEGGLSFSSNKELVKEEKILNQKSYPTN